MKQITDNFKKHKNNNPLQKILINNFYKTLINLAKLLNVNTVLDAGCGEGFTLSKLYENKIGKNFEGIEQSKDAIDLGKKMFPYLKLKQGSVYNLPFKDDSFELVVCTEVLEHLENPRKALSEILRVSKKYIILSVPNEPFFKLSNLLRGKNITKLGNDIGHINHWNPYSFKKFIKNKTNIKKFKLPFPWIMVLLEKNTY